MAAFYFMDIIALLHDIFFPRRHYFFQVAETAIPGGYMGCSAGFGLQVGFTKGKYVVVAGVCSNNDVKVHIAPILLLNVGVEYGNFHSG